MNRSAATTFVLALCVLASAVPAAAQEAPPNIVFIISDDHAWTDYGFMGHPHIETPNLDALAKQSAVFTRGYVPTALCRPALATLATGLYAHQHGITGNDPALLPSMAAPGAVKQPEPDQYRVLRETLISKIDRAPTLPALLAARGYVSHQSGKWWEGSFARGGFTHGMTRGFPQPGGRHGDDGLRIGRDGMQPVLEFIDGAIDRQQPFFVWYAPFLPHTPHDPPQRLLDKYSAGGATPDRIARYYAMVEWFDETTGVLLAHLDARGVAGRTLVVYIGDNGWIQRPDANDFAPRSKQSPNEGGVRQPTMFRWPGVIQPGDRGTQLSSSIDIVPTALAAAGVDPPASLPGLNLLPSLRSGAPTPRQEVLGEGFAHDIADLDDPEASLLYRWVIQGRWKLLLTYDGTLGRHAKYHPRTERRPQLFDLLADPHEDVNVAGSHADVVAALADRLAAWWPVKSRAVQTTFPNAPGSVLFFDGFDDPTLNRDAWNVIVTGRVVNNEQQAYVDSPDTIGFVRGADAGGAEGGALVLRARHRPGFTSPEGRAFDFISGRIDTRDKVTFTYGTAAARIRLTAGTGLWPAFWALGADRWPDTGEIDIMENVGDPSWVNAALHGPGYSGNTPLVKRRPFPAGQDSTGWHVYSVTWTPDTIRFAVDDDVYYEVTRAMVEAHGRWAFDTPKHLIVNLALGGAYPQGVNKVTQPYPGLPQETVNLIRGDEVTMLVDWVRITRPD